MILSFSKLLTTETILQIISITIIAIIVLLIIFEIVKITKSLLLAYQKISKIKKIKIGSKILSENGYNVISTEPQKEYKIFTNNQIASAAINSDYIVEKQGYTFVANIIKNKSNFNVKNDETRRLIFEYIHLYNVSGVILLNIKKKEINQIQIIIDETKGKLTK